MRQLFARAEILAPHALFVGAFIWLLAGLLFGQFFYPGQGPDGSFYAGLSVDPLTDAEAQEYRQTARLIVGACVLAACAQGVVAWLYRRNRIARWITAGIGGCYAVLSVACVAVWIAYWFDSDASAFLVYAGITGALSVPMLGAVARATRGETGVSAPPALPFGRSISGAAILMAFIAGTLAVPMFSRVLWLILYVADVAPSTSLSDLIWSSLRGGVWGVVFQLTLPRWFRGTAYWVAVVLVGGVAPTLVHIFVVWPLEFGTMPPDVIRYFVTYFPFGAIWGFGWALLLALFQKMRAANTALPAERP